MKLTMQSEEDPSEIEIRLAEIVRIEPGDVIVIKAACELRAVERDRIGECLRTALGNRSDVKVIVLSNGASLEVLRRGLTESDRSEVS